MRPLAQLDRKGNGVTTHPYREIAERIAAAIVAGDYKAGELLPTVRDLAEQEGIAPGTARRVIETLQASGLVYSGWFDGKRGVKVRSRGRTDFFATDALRPGRIGAGDAFRENAHKAGRDPDVRFTMLLRVPPADVARRLGIAPDALAVERTTVQLLDGEPWSRERSWYDPQFAAETGVDTTADLPDGVIRQLTDRGYRETAHRDEVTDTIASTEDASDLAVPVGTPLLVQVRTAATDDRVTRVTQTVRLGNRNRLIWETGTSEGLDVIRHQLAAGADLVDGTSDPDAPSNGGNS